MRPSGRAPSLLEKGTCLVVLLGLASTAAGVFLKQFSFNPAVLVARDLAQSARSVAVNPEQSPAWLPPDLKPFGAPESFTPDNLYDKIDGKAELYLAAGVAGMQCRRFALKEGEDQWLEWFVYDMGSLSQAFSVFSTQRRPEGESIDLTPYAYRTQNALYFVCGSNYIEAVASSANEPLMQAILTMAGRFVAETASTTAGLPELQILPAENLVPGSQTLQSTDAFGFDQFKNVFTAQYKMNDSEFMAYVTACDNARSAAALADAYRAFLLANGGKEIASQTGTGFGKPVEIMGSFEFVFSNSKFVAGVRSAPSIPAAEQLASRLRDCMTQKTGGAK